MYKKESQFNQKPVRLHEINSEYDEKILSIKEKRDSLILATEKIAEELHEIKKLNKISRSSKERSDRRKYLRERYEELNRKLEKITPLVKTEKILSEDFDRIFIDVCHEFLDRFKFNLILKEAKNRLKDRQNKLKELHTNKND